MKSLVPTDSLEELNTKVYDAGHVDREHLTEFLTLIPSNDARQIIWEVKNWLQSLHSDPKYSKVIFPPGHIDSILGDLDSYGRVQPETLYQFKQNSKMVPPQI